MRARNRHDAHKAYQRVVPYFKLKANVHVPALRREAFVRRLGTEEYLGGLKYQDLCKKIKDNVTERWKDNNQSKQVPKDFTKTFMPVSNANFSYDN
jgi:hypothetical protein